MPLKARGPFDDEWDKLSSVSQSPSGSSREDYRSNSIVSRSSVMGRRLEQSNVYHHPYTQDSVYPVGDETFYRVNPNDRWGLKSTSGRRTTNVGLIEPERGFDDITLYEGEISEGYMDQEQPKFITMQNPQRTAPAPIQYVRTMDQPTQYIRKVEQPIQQPIQYVTNVEQPLQSSTQLVQAPTPAPQQYVQLVQAAPPPPPHPMPIQPAPKQSYVLRKVPVSTVPQPRIVQRPVQRTVLVREQSPRPVTLVSAPEPKPMYTVVEQQPTPQQIYTVAPTPPPLPPTTAQLVPIQHYESDNRSMISTRRPQQRVLILDKEVY